MPGILAKRLMRGIDARITCLVLALLLFVMVLVTAWQATWIRRYQRIQSALRSIAHGPRILAIPLRAVIYSGLETALANTTPGSLPSPSLAVAVMFTIRPIEGKEKFVLCVKWIENSATVTGVSIENGQTHEHVSLTIPESWHLLNEKGERTRGDIIFESSWVWGPEDVPVPLKQGECWLSLVQGNRISEENLIVDRLPARGKEQVPKDNQEMVK